MSDASAFRPRRSVLYMPGANARALEKARTLDADALILDLEDAVAPDAKALARDQVCAAVKEGGYGRREVVIRINALDTPWGETDLGAAIAAAPHAILVPKVDDAAAVEELCVALERAGAAPDLKLWVMIETPRAIMNVGAIAATRTGPDHRLACLVMGLNDLVKETRVTLDGERTGALYWLSASVTAARTTGLDILDGVYNDFKDGDGFLHEAKAGLALGMDGKTLIHPSQIAPCNEVFTPSADAVAHARAIIAAFALPENAGKGVITVDGRMVELLHAEMARRTVALADATTQG